MAPITIWVRVKPTNDRPEDFVCGILFTRDWTALAEVDDATVRRLRAEASIEVSTTEPVGGVIVPSGGKTYDMAAKVRFDELSGQVLGIVAGGQDVLINFADLAGVVISANVAQAAATSAALSRDAAILGAGLWPDEPTGRLAVGDGESYRVQGAGDVAAYVYRRTNAVASQLIGVYPSKAAVDAIRGDIHKDGLRMYNGAGPIYPIATDAAGAVVLGFDAAKQSIVGAGLVNHAEASVTAKAELAAAQTCDYLGSGPVYPLLTDRAGRVLLGYDMVSDSLVGIGIASESIAVAPAIPLAASLRPISRTVNHLLFYGQSLSVGASGGSVLSLTQPYSNITFSGGPRAWTGSAYDFSNFKPLVEDAVSPAPDNGTNRTETPCSGAANYATTLSAIEDGSSPEDHVILASTAGHGGYTIALLSKGSAWYTSTLAPHIVGAKSLAADYTLQAFAWIQGEQDVYIGTSYTTYRAALEQLQADIEGDAIAISAQASPVYCLMYQTAAMVMTSADIALAQLDLCQKNQKFFMATPIYHMPHAADGVHLLAAGYKWMGAYFGRAYKRLVRDGVQPRWLNPLSSTRRGVVIRVRFDVPVLPLVLDTATLAATTDYGFVVLDGATPLPIASIDTDGQDVVITLVSAPAGAVTVRYALDYLGAGLTISGGASGNLRDSDPSIIDIGGSMYPLYNVSPHFQLTVITLGE